MMWLSSEKKHIWERKARGKEQHAWTQRTEKMASTKTNQNFDHSGSVQDSHPMPSGAPATIRMCLCPTQVLFCGHEPVPRWLLLAINRRKPVSVMNTI